MQKFLQALEHHMVQYLTIGFFGVFAAILLFWVGGSLAEVTGNEKSVAGVSFKAGGVFAGFLLVFFASTPIIKGLRRLEERGKTLEEQEKRLQAGREDLERKARPHLKLHFTSSPKLARDLDYRCGYTLYNDETGTTTSFNATPHWEAGFLTIVVQAVGRDDLIDVRLEAGGQVWHCDRFYARARVVQLTRQGGLS